jgi:hypothetical protein
MKWKIKCKWSAVRHLYANMNKKCIREADFEWKINKIVKDDTRMWSDAEKKENMENGC